MAEHIKWVNSRKNNFVDNKISGGLGVFRIFVARAKYEGGVHPGKYLEGRSTDSSQDEPIDTTTITYNGKEIECAEYQVATGDRTLFKWVWCAGPFYNKITEGRPVQAGFEIINNGWDVQPLYVANTASVSNNQCGKVAEGSFPKFGENGKEYSIPSLYYVLYTVQ